MMQQPSFVWGHPSVVPLLNVPSTTLSACYMSQVSAYEHWMIWPYKVTSNKSLGVDRCGFFSVDANT